MADEFENTENKNAEDDGQISEDDWAAAMAEQAVADADTAPPAAAAASADIFPSFGGAGAGAGGMMN